MPVVVNELVINGSGGDCTSLILLVSITVPINNEFCLFPYKILYLGNF